MTSGNHRDTGTSAAAAVLDRARGHRRDADAAEVALLADVLAWAELHVTSDPDSAETWGDTPVLLGGEGCPWIREFTITELATALHLSLPAGRALVAEVLELAFRLPRLWAKVQSGRVQSWRARRIARLTGTLSLEAASYVDNQVAGFAHRIGQAAIERLVEEAIGRHMPDLARKQREQAADRRHFTIHHRQVSFEGTCLVEGEIDLADALDLDAALGHIAGEMGALGTPSPSTSAGRWRPASWRGRSTRSCIASTGPPPRSWNRSWSPSGHPPASPPRPRRQPSRLIPRPQWLR